MSPIAQPVVIEVLENGSTLAIVDRDNHVVDVYRIPVHATITIHPQPGFGLVEKTSSAVSKADAEIDIYGQLTANQAF